MCFYLALAAMAVSAVTVIWEIGMHLYVANRSYPLPSSKKSCDSERREPPSE